MKNKDTKKTREEHAAGVREHSRKYGFPVKRKETSKNKTVPSNRT